MKILCMSDLHGHLPDNLPASDAVIIAGDVCPVFDHSVSFQRLWLKTNFVEWANRLNTGSIVLIAGNHDFIFEADPGYGLYLQEFHAPNLHYLQDNMVHLEDPESRKLVSVWGSPWSLNFGPWAFMGSDSAIGKYLDDVPDGTNIIVSHTPPYRVCDRTVDDQNPGSKYLGKLIREKQPELVVCGHIHEAYGVGRIGNTKIINASHMDVAYEPINPAIMYRTIEV